MRDRRVKDVRLRLTAVAIFFLVTACASPAKSPSRTRQPRSTFQGSSQSSPGESAVNPASGGITPGSPATVLAPSPASPVANSVANSQTGGVRDADRLLIPDASDLMEREGLTPLQVKTDMDLLIYALRDGYGGRKFIKPELFKGVISALEQTSATTSRGLLEAADRILFAIPDSHLTMRSPTTGLSKYRLARTRTGRIGANIAAGKVWSFERREQSAILGIAQWPAPEDERWRDFKGAVTDALRSPTVILDLRGNGGGSDVMAAWLAGRVLGHDVVSPFASILRRQTPEAQAIAANAWKLKIVWNRVDKKPVPDYFTQRLNEKMKDYAAAKRGDLPAEQRFAMEYPHEAPTTPFNGRVILIIDAECASSCESTVEFFEGAPNVLTIGESTAGAVHFGNPGFVLLPNSQLMVQIATDFWSYRDGRNLERIGHSPRVQVKAGEDGLNLALRAARSR